MDKELDSLIERVDDILYKIEFALHILNNN